MANPGRKRKRSITPDRIEERLRRLERDMEDVLADVDAGATAADDLDPVRRRRIEHTLASFADRMRGGSFKLSYLVRATIAGEFTAAPAHAEAMYEPAVTGRSAAARLVVSR